MSRRLAGLAPIALIAIVTLAGCGSVTGPASRSDSVAAPRPSPSAPSHHDLAVSDAATHIASFRPPAGAHQLAGRPMGTPMLDPPMVGSTAAITVTRTTWWRAPGKPTAVLQAIQTPAGAVRDGIDSSSGDAAWVYDLDFDWPRQTGVLAMRFLEVTAQAVGSQTVFRVDAITTWVPPRDPATFVPASTDAVTITYGSRAIGAGGVRQESFGPATVTDPAIVRAIIAAIDADPVETQGARPCPASLHRMSLAFHRTAPEATVATIDIDTGGCDDAFLQITGGKSAGLSGGTALVTTIMSVAKLTWPRPQ